MTTVTAPPTATPLQIGWPFASQSYTLSAFENGENAVKCLALMRLKRTISEAEFAAAIRYLRLPSKLTLEMAHADLVQGINQADIARKLDRTKGTVSQASKIVWRGFLKSKGYREVRVVLGDFQAFVVNSWHKEALYELNHGTKMPEKRDRRKERSSQKAEQSLEQ